MISAIIASFTSTLLSSTIILHSKADSGCILSSTGLPVWLLKWIKRETVKYVWKQQILKSWKVKVPFHCFSRGKLWSKAFLKQRKQVAASSFRYSCLGITRGLLCGACIRTAGTGELPGARSVTARCVVSSVERWNEGSFTASCWSPSIKANHEVALLPAQNASKRVQLRVKHRSHTAWPLTVLLAWSRQPVSTEIQHFPNPQCFTAYQNAIPCLS